ncbi:MAG: catechol 2,3-dioxygenase [Coriobacteriia bacterium]|nr:catechol 2,3-dioxygenase [Coriobacteriia bacterium]
MAITGVLRSALMQLRVLDMDAAVNHYVNVLGLDEVGKTEDGRVMLKAYDEFEHHTFVLRLAETAGMDFIGFKVDSDAYLDQLAAETQAFGLPCEWLAAETDQPGFGRRLVVQMPTGHRFDFFADVAMAEDRPMLKNPDIWQKEPHGMRAQCFDHALLYGPNSAEAVRYCTEVLKMAVVEELLAPEGDGKVCTWLTSSNRMHDIAILEYDQPGKLHHVGFKLEDWSAIGNAADLITINNVSLDAGPMRHGVTRGLTIYFFDPSGNRNETYAGGYAHFPDMPVRQWDFDQAGKGIFYYTRELNERFLSVVS